MIQSAFARIAPGLRAVLDAQNITSPTPIQERAIPPLLDGRDVVGQARTGSGKTLAFSLPLVERLDPARRGVQALVLVPTRELAVQVGDVLGRLAQTRRLRLQLLYGGRSLLPEKQALVAGAQIVVGTPGRTLDHLRQGNLRLEGVRFLVLDEADEMLDRGFAPDVERIISFTPRERQTAMFSATVPEWVAATAAKHLRNPVNVQVDRDEDTPPEIEHVVYEVDPSVKLNALRTLLDQRGDGPMLVFGRTKHGVKKLAKQLAGFGYPAAALQGNMSQNARERVMADFRAGTVPILLATNVAARGIDVDGIEQVINYELPESAELFTHRSGRTGRMGRQGEVITFVTYEDADKWRQIERKLGKKLPRQPWRGQPSASPAPAPAARAPFAAPAPRPPARLESPRPAAPRSEQSRRDTTRRFDRPASAAPAARDSRPEHRAEPRAQGDRPRNPRRRFWRHRARPRAAAPA